MDKRKIKMTLVKHKKQIQVDGVYEFIEKFKKQVKLAFQKELKGLKRKRDETEADAICEKLENIKDKEVVERTLDQDQHEYTIYTPYGNYYDIFYIFKYT